MAEDDCGSSHADAVLEGQNASFRSNHATASRIVKGESMLYMICDGHTGVSAAQFVTANLHGELCARLPAQPPNLSEPEELKNFAELLRGALAETFVAMDNQWLSHRSLASSKPPGSTITAMVVIGQLLTVANIGDSTAVLDTGSSMLDLTTSHRIHTNDSERMRLKKAGCTVASIGFHLQGPAAPNEPGVGPLRIWPGGLCVSRSIGDIDAGPEIIPLPHVKQVLLPNDGCRVIMASDGLWDVVTLSQAVKMTRAHHTQGAASALVAAASRSTRIIDDTSVIVVDILPPAGPPSFHSILKPAISEKRGGLFACFRPELEVPDAREITGPGRLSLLADVDCLVAYAPLIDTLARNSIVLVPRSHRHPVGKPLGMNTSLQRDLTLHLTPSQAAGVAGLQALADAAHLAAPELPVQQQSGPQTVETKAVEQRPSRVMEDSAVLGVLVQQLSGRQQATEPKVVEQRPATKVMADSAVVGVSGACDLISHTSCPDRGSGGLYTAKLPLTKLGTTLESSSPRPSPKPQSKLDNVGWVVQRGEGMQGLEEEEDGLFRGCSTP